MRLSVIVPTYNERDSLPHLLDRLRALQPRIALEVVVVDDASPDGTGRLAEGYARDGGLPLMVVHREGKGGLASAAIDGATASHGEIVSVMDADLSHPPELLVDLAGALADGADLAIASRYVPGGGVEAWPIPRRVVSRTATWLARAALGLRVRDPLSGYFAARRELLTRGAYMGIGYKLLVEVLARHPRARVVEIPYRFVDRAHGASKLSGGEMLDYLRLLIMLRVKGRTWNSAHS